MSADPVVTGKAAEVMRALAADLAEVQAGLTRASTAAKLTLAVLEARAGSAPRRDNGELPSPGAPAIMDLFRIGIDDLGVVRLQRWPEGLVLWCGGVIVWRSWGPPAARVPFPDQTATLELDAARYRWLRAQRSLLARVEEGLVEVVGDGTAGSSINGDLDAAIDAARLA